MAAAPGINKILSEVKQLDRGDQFMLLQQIAGFLKKQEAVPKPVNLTALSGLGSALWKTTADIDNYIEEERQW